MSAASFISLLGRAVPAGFPARRKRRGPGLLLGWTGGFCLVAILVAPHLQAVGIHGSRFLPCALWRALAALAALAAVLTSFTYVVAQIYGMGLIASRLTGVQFEIGIMLGLGGAAVLVFLGACAPSPGRRWRSTWCCCWRS